MQDQAQAGGVAELGDAMQIGDESLGVVVLRSGEERLQRLRRQVRRATQDVEVEPAKPVPMPVEQAREQLRVDRSEVVGRRAAA